MSKGFVIWLKYGSLAFVFSVLAALFLQWSLSWEALWLVLRSPISFFDKVDFFWDGYVSMWRNALSFRGLGAVLFSALAGMNGSLLVFIYRVNRKASAAKSNRAAKAAMTLGLFSTGCIACGTSILAPILTFFGATSVGFLRGLSAAFVWASVVLLAYSVRKLWPVADSLCISVCYAEEPKS